LANLTIEDIKAQKRWVLWKLAKRDGKDTKVPYQVSGRHADSTDPATWATYAEVSANTVGYSGVGVVLAEVDGIHVSGCDIDNCCDAVTGKFTAESREIVIGLDSYAEYSPSGTGCHILVIGNLRGRKGIKLPFPGSKEVEVYDRARYLTFTGRHLKKTPDAIIEREDKLNALYDRVQASKARPGGLVVHISVSEEERLQRLMAGDISLYHDDHSTADYALCCLLAKKFDCNAFKINAEFEKSGLYRDKWDREDYRENTITRAIKAVARDAQAIFTDAESDPMEDDGPTEYLVDALGESMHEGWFPKGEVSLIGGSSGAGKTSWAMPLLEKIRKGVDVFGHTAKPRDYRVLLHDRSKKAMNRTVKSLGLSREAIERVIRLSTEQQSCKPGDILEAAIEREPGVECWFIEGLDLWITDPNKMEVVGPVIDGLQRIATRRDVAVLATVGSPKQRGKDNKYFGRDALFGSAALARKVETVVLMQLHDENDPNSVRRCTVLPRNGRAETLFFEWQSEGLCVTTEPRAVPELRAIDKMEQRIFAAVQPGDLVRYQPGFGNRNLFFDWEKRALKEGKITRSNGKYFRAYPLSATVN
jgi:hypothetical protein